MKIKEYKTAKWKELVEWNYDAKNLASFMGIKTAHDTALPQQWLDEFIKKSGLDYHKVIYSSFMIYSKDDYWGTPYSAWDTCQKAMNRMREDWIKDSLADHYAEKIKVDLNRLCGIEMKEAYGKLSQDIIKSLNNNDCFWTNGGV